MRAVCSLPPSPASGLPTMGSQARLCGPRAVQGKPLMFCYISLCVVSSMSTRLRRLTSCSSLSSSPSQAPGGGLSPNQQVAYPHGFLSSLLSGWSWRVPGGQGLPAALLDCLFTFFVVQDRPVGGNQHKEQDYIIIIRQLTLAY